MYVCVFDLNRDHNNMDDLIVVDDEPSQAATQGAEAVDAQAFYSRAPRTIAESVMRSSRRRSTPPVGGSLKLSEKATAAMASGTSFLGAYDRELDSDDEDLTFEEQFILRMPPGEDCEKLRKLVSTRETSNDLWFKFKAVFNISNSLYSAKLVDLPCIIESQKTLDNKQMFKVADICQMLVVQDKIDSEEVVANQKGFNLDEFIWPHGITPPLHHVRKRRFRKRLNKRTIETVEQEVERLLEEDAKAGQVRYDVLENVNPDLSDSEFVDHDINAQNAQNVGHQGSNAIDALTPGVGADEEFGSEDEDEGEIDEELAAELDLALGDEGEDGDEEVDEDDEDASDEEDEDEDEDDEAVQARRLLNEEIRDLEAAVAKKNTEIANSANPLIRRRFEDALRKLQADLDSKLLQRDELSEQQRMRKEGINAPQEDFEPNEDGEDSAEIDVL
ncbi:hypothetical protein EW145_g3675 [Phellinidium pouzarii]|uniref:TAFII55 protein conserved region domain-containing protein n=1 Tax=Phellinidium pouzarii TaxID=167371 RepID=A0A4S4L864_9AGAM|nr:hypothetical protein EW145_g3675 [Phellinidium pouzarii]